MRTSPFLVPFTGRVATAFLLICGASAAHATDSGVEWSFGVPQRMALGLGAGDATYHRVSGSCAQLSPTATAARYDTIVVSNIGRRSGVLDVRTRPLAGGTGSTCPASMDTVLTAYSGTFNPANASAGCLAINDDEAGGTSCSRLSNLTIPAGGSITLVVAGADNDQRFPYDLIFDESRYGGDGIYLASFEPSETYVGRQLPASGEFRVDGYPAPFAAGSRLDGGEDDAGVIRARLALAPVQLQDIATNLGFVTLRLQMWQNGRGTGQAAPIGNASYGANDLFLRLQHATVNGNPVDIGGNCQFGPITWALTGNADAQSIDLTQASFTIPPGASTACNNFGTQLNAIIAGSDNSVTIGLER
jgi:hypothetical protein